MTELTTTTPDPATSLSDWETKRAEHERRGVELRPRNKTTVFDVLAAAGVAVVVVTFDGYGDSGQIENIEAKVGDQVAALPSGDVEIISVVWGEAELDRTMMTVRDAIERLAYDFLQETHDGWWSRDEALSSVAGASFPIPLAEPDVRVSKHPALHARLAPRVALTVRRGCRMSTRTDRLRAGTTRPARHSIRSVCVCPGFGSVTRHPRRRTRAWRGLRPIAIVSRADYGRSGDTARAMSRSDASSAASGRRVASSTSRDS